MQAWEKSKVPGKIFTYEILSNQKFYRDLSWPCFFTAGRPAWSLHTFACFFCGLVPGPGAWGVRLFGFSPQYIMPVIGSRNTAPTIASAKVGNTTERQAEYNLHYVNIALGTVFPGVSFCLSARAALAGFVLPQKISPQKNKSRHVLRQGRA